MLKILKKVIAFANTGGGKVFIGVEDDGSVIGLNNVDDTMLNALRDSIKQDITLFPNCFFETIEK